jgi:fatty-acyl-CoA synthase
VCAAVVINPPEAGSPDQLTRLVTERLGHHYTPETVLIVPEVPLTGAQKPDAAALRRLVEQLVG